MTTVFAYDPTGFVFTLDRKPDATNSSQRDLQLALFQTASGKSRALKRKIEVLRLSFAFRDLCAQEEADLTHFNSQVVLDSIRYFRLSLGAFIATPIACGETFGSSAVAVTCGQNLSALDTTLPAAPMQCGRFYHGQRTITLPRCKFVAGSYDVAASGNDQRNGYDVSFSLLCEWGC